MNAAQPAFDTGHAQFPAKVYLASLALPLLVTGVAFAAVPTTLAAPSIADLLPVAVVVLVAIYAVAGIMLLRAPSPSDATSARLGLLAGALWSVEIFVGGPARLDYGTEQALGATFALAATAVTIAAGPIVQLRRNLSRETVRAGAFAGLVSGVFVFVFATAMTLLTLGTLASRGDYRQQFIGSARPRSTPSWSRTFSPPRAHT